MGRCALALCMLLGGAHSVLVPPDDEAKQKAGDKDKVDKVRIELYYETLCPYCRRFISKSLVPLWEDKNFRDIVNITMVPYGNAMTLAVANVSAGYKFWHQELESNNINSIFECQHYERECFGNLVHSCAIKHFNGPTQYMPLFGCMAAAVNDSLEKSSYKCSQEQGISLDNVRTCTRGREGTKLLEKYGRKTLGLEEPEGPKKWVPWVVINGKHNKRSELDGNQGYNGYLLDEVCKQLKKEVKPISCASAKLRSPSGTVRRYHLWSLVVLSLTSVFQVFL